MDTDGDGNVSLDEFVSARPSDVSEDQATNLFNSFDSEGAGSLTTEQLSEAMANNRPGGPRGGAGAPPSDDDLSDIFASLDTDGDGVISEDEFTVARPSDVSEDQASSLFQSLDTEGTGALSEDQFVTAMKSQMPPAPPQSFFDLYSAIDQDDSTASETMRV